MLGFGPIASSPLGSSGDQSTQLVATKVTAAPALVATPTLGQSHTLTPNEVESTIAVSNAAVTQNHGLTGSDVSAANATVESAVATQFHNFDTTPIYGGNPIVHVPSFGTGVALGTPVSRSAPATISIPAFAQANLLFGADVSAGSSTTSSPAVGQDHKLPVRVVRGSEPSSSASGFVQDHALADGTTRSGAGTISAPTFNRIINLAASSVSGSAPQVQTSDLLQMHQFGSVAIRAASTVDHDSFAQNHKLPTSAVFVSSPSVSDSWVTRRYIFDESSLLSRGSVSTPVYNISARRSAVPGGSVNFAKTAKPQGSVNFAIKTQV